METVSHIPAPHKQVSLIMDPGPLQLTPSLRLYALDIQGHMVADFYKLELHICNINCKTV